MGQILTEKEYFEERSERIGASEIERTGLYEANIRQVAQERGIFAVKDVVRITEIDNDGADFRVSMMSQQSGKIILGRITLNGIVYQGETTEKGYLVVPPMDELDHEIEALFEKYSDKRPLFNYILQQENTKYLEAPLD